MRLADVDMIYDEVEKQYKGATGIERNCNRNFLNLICHAPTIDAVPVVRCRECKHYHSDTGWCDQLSYFQTSDGEPCSPAESMDWKMFQENDYCSMGQRKESEHD